MDERRRDTRSRTYLGGVIAFNDASSSAARDCVVRDLSSGGANLSLESLSGVPREFDVFIPRLKSHFCARLVWRDDDQAGVVFLRPAAGKVVSIEASRRVREIEAQHQVLERRIAQIVKRASR